MKRLAVLVSCLALVACGLLGEQEDNRVRVPTVRVLKFGPTGALEATQNIRVHFSEPLVRDEAVGQPQIADDVLAVSPALKGRGRWVAADIFELEPSQPLAPNTRYSVRIRERSVGPNRRLVGKRRFAFHTPLFRVESVTGARIDGLPQVVVELSHTVRSDDAAGAVTFRDVDGVVLQSHLLGEGTQARLRFNLPSVSGDTEGVQLRVEPTLAPSSGGVALDKPVIVQVRFEPVEEPEVISADIVHRGGEPAIRLRFNTAIQRDQVRPFIRIDPPVTPTFTVEHHSLILQGGLRPGALHTILLREGLLTPVGPLPGDAEFEVQVPHLTSALRFEADRPLLVAEGDTVSLTAVNVGALKVRALRVPDRNVAHIDLDSDSAPSSLGRVVAEIELEGPSSEDLAHNVDLPLKSLLRGGPGLYRIEVEDTEHAWVRAHGWLVQTDLLLTAKTGVDYLSARVQSMTQASVRGARVSAYSRTGRQLFVISTGANGVAEYVGALDPDDPIAWLVAHNGRKSAYLPMQDSIVPFGDSPEANRSPAFVWTVQDYLLAGETVHGFALLDRRPLSPLKWELVGPEGPLPVTKAAVFDGSGLGQVTLALEGKTPPGAYLLRLIQANGAIRGQAGFRVVDREPSALQIRVESPKLTKVGGPIAFDVHVTSRFGGRTSGLPVKARCRYRSQRLAVETAVGFSFGDHGTQARWGAELEAVPTKVGAESRAMVTCPTPPAGTPVGHRVQVEVQVSVYEAGGRPAFGAARVLTDVRPYYVGLRQRQGVLQALVVGPDGQAISDIGLKARIDALSVSKDTTSKSVLVQATSDTKPVVLPFEDAAPGHYRARVQTQQALRPTTLDFWVLTGTSAVPLSHVEVTAPESAAKVGQSIPLQLSLPFAGRLRVTVERDRVLHTAVFDGRSRDMQIEIPALASFAPTARVVVQLEGESGRAYGAAVLQVQDDSRHLDVQLELPDGANDGRFPVQIRVTGAKRKMKAILTVVSSERTTVAGEQRRDPRLHFAQSQAIEVTTHDPTRLFDPVALRARPLVSSPETPDEPRRVPASQLPHVSELIKVSDRGFAWAAARAPTGAGPAVLSVVVSDGHAVGRAEIHIPGGSRPGLRLHAPKSLLPGDRVQVPVSIKNTSSRSFTATAIASTEGPLKVSGPKRLQVTVPAGEVRTVDFTIGANHRGTGRMQVDVQTSAAESSASASILVRSAISNSILGASAEAKHKSPGDLKLPQSLDLKSATARLVVGPGRVHRYAAALDALRFPALEGPTQAAPRGLGLLAVPELAKAMGAGDGTKQRWLQDLSIVSELVDAEGWVMMWPKGPRADARTVLQVALLHVEARRRGVLRSTVSERRLLQRLQGLLADAQAGLQDRGVAAYVLARGGVRGFEIPAPLIEAEAPAMVRALAGAALVASGRARAGRTVLGQRFEPSASAKDVAWTLWALTTSAPAHPSIEGLRTALESAATAGRWNDAETNAIALRALARLDRVSGPRRPYWGSIMSGDTVVKRFNNKRLTVLEVPALQWASGLHLTVTGAGRAQASLSVVGPAKEAGGAVSQGLELSRRSFLGSGETTKAGTAELGALWATEVRVKAGQNKAEGPVLVDIPMPAGFTLERVWPTALPDPATPVGGVQRVAGGLRWRVNLADAELRLVFTMRAVRSGTFAGPATAAWRADAPSVWARTAARTWTVRSP